MLPIISIVVPVYKVENYLHRCVQCLIDQTFSAFEIILVDDGSPDHCPDICDDLARQDERIRVIHKENSGLSDARNSGLKAAEGKYVLFVDSDDYIITDACSEFMKAIGDKEPDIVVGNAYIIENTRKSKMIHSYHTNGQAVTGESYLKEELKNRTMYMPTWLNLYNRIFLLKNSLVFKSGLLHEDEEFTPRAFLKAEKVIGTDIVFYYYIVREGSITQMKDKIRNADSIIQICKELEQIYNNIADDLLRRLLNDHLVIIYLSIFQEAEIYKKQNVNLIDKNFLKSKAYTKRNKLKVALFSLNIKLYFYTNKFSKLILKHIKYSKQGLDYDS